MRATSGDRGDGYSVGVIGTGFIGRHLVSRIQAAPEMSLAFVHGRRAEQADAYPGGVFLADLRDMEARSPDLIVEAAHPSYTARYGEDFLACADYLPLSTSALIDAALLGRLQAAARAHDTRLLLAAGALIGGEELAKRHQGWDRVRITFRKHPDNIDFSDVPLDPDQITEATTVFEGSVAEIAARYPRNVNTMVTAALLSTGVQDCEGVLIADPALDCAVAEVEAWGADGGTFRTEKRQPATGVSGTEMIASAWYSVLRAGGIASGPFEIV